MMLDLPQLTRLINGYSDTLFRLETLDRYQSGSDGADVDRYLAGEPEPDPARKEPWLARLRSERAEGRRRQRVHKLSSRPTISGYLRYECEWGYLMNAEAGEEIFILDVAERPLPPPLDGIDDFWAVDDRIGIQMWYDGDARFAGAEIVSEAELPRYLAARDAALAAAEPFATWWARHPEFHQANNRAA